MLKKKGISMSLFRRLLSSNLGQLVIEIVSVAIPVLLLEALLNLLPASFLQSTAGDVLLNILAAAIIIVVFQLALRKLEHRSLSDVGLSKHQWLRQLLLSFFCGGALMTVVILALAITGSYHITGIHPFAAVELVFLIISLCLLALLFVRNAKVGFFHYMLFVFLLFGLLTTAVSLVILIAGAIQEEFIFRGMIFCKLERSFGSWIALAVSAILFGLIHLANPNATLVSAIALMVTGGVLSAAIYMLTRSLWWAIGVHLGWNFFEGSVFGTQVSGHVQPGIFSSVITGPVAWVGGSFGPEAGLASILIVGSVGFFLCFRAARQHRMLPHNRRRHTRYDAQSGRNDIPVNL
jgi:membrane protease YdiL (CAAX protease family)